MLFEHEFVDHWEYCRLWTRSYATENSTWPEKKCLILTPVHRPIRTKRRYYFSSSTKCTGCACAHDHFRFRGRPLLVTWLLVTSGPVMWLHNHTCCASVLLFRTNCPYECRNNCQMFAIRHVWYNAFVNLQCIIKCCSEIMKSFPVWPTVPFEATILGN
jgi:hypothetical protein